MKNRCDLKKTIVLLLTLCLLAGNLYQVYGTEDIPHVSVSDDEVVVEDDVSENGTEEETPEDLKSGDANENVDDQTVSEDGTAMPSDKLSAVSEDNAEGLDEDYATGYIPVELDVPDTYYPEGAEEPAGGYLPSSYLPNIITEITSVKDQGSEGFCWAYSAAAVMEQSGLKTGAGSLSTDYNEHQLNAGFNGNHKNDPLNLTAGDRSFKNIDGNNNIFTTWLLASQVAPVSQTEAQTAGYEERAASLVEAKMFQADNIDEIKQAILDYGAVTIGIDSANYNGNNKLTYGYRQAYHYNENHAVTLIGWDNNIDSSLFGDKNGDKFSSASYNICPGNGGFKFKNSWGSSVGESGYQYISYYDNAFTNGNRVIAYKIDRKDSFDTVYEYDGSYGSSRQYVTRAANIYTAAANNTVNGAEEINRLGFGTYDTGDYIISLYVNNNNEPLTSSPNGQWFMNDENLAASKEVSVTNSGYYTADIDDPVRIEEGREFAVVLKKKDNSLFTMFTDETYNNGDWISFTADTSNEKTFAQQNSYVMNTSNFTPRLKAFSCNIPTINPVHTDLSGADTYVRTKQSTYTYTGSQIKPVVIVKDSNGTVIPMAGNYTVSYGENLDAGISKGSLSVTGVAGGLCSGSKTLLFNIDPADLSNTTGYCYYSGTWNEAELENQTWSFSPFFTNDIVAKYLKLSLNGKELVRGADYYVNDPASPIESTDKYKLYLIGKGNFKGSRYTFVKGNGSKIDINSRVFFSLPDGTIGSNIVNDSDIEVEYTGDLPVITDLKLTHSTRGVLVPGVDYSIINNNTTIKDANSSFTVTASGKGIYSGTRNESIYIVPASISSCQVLGLSNKPYTGSAITFDNIEVKLNGKTLTKGTDYTLEYSNNINVGTNAKVKIRGKGNYSNEKSVTFTIDKAVPVLSNLSATDIVSGHYIRDSILSGTAKNGTVNVPGTFAFKYPLTQPPVGTAYHDVVFTPDDMDNYEIASGSVALTVTDPSSIQLIAPVVDEQTYRAGRKLADITINNPAGNPAGSWRWKSPNTLLTAPGGVYRAVFSYEDQSQADKETDITVAVKKAAVVLGNLAATGISYGQSLGDSTITGTALCGSDRVRGTFRFSDPSIIPARSDSNSTYFEVLFIPDDYSNYNTATGSVMLDVGKTEPDLTVPSISDVTYSPGLKLSDITIVNPTENVSGTWQWENSSTLLTVPGGLYPAIFTPDSDEYCSVGKNINIRVLRAYPRISSLDQTKLDNLTLPKGQSLSSITGSLPAGFRWGDNVDTSVIYNTVGEVIYADVVYNPDIYNYYDNIGEAIITVVEPSVPSKEVSITVINGIAKLDGKIIGSALPGTKVDLIANVPEGSIFRTWNVTNATLDSNTEQTKMTVGNADVVAEAVIEDDPDYNGEEPPEPEDFDGKIKSLSIINENLKKVKTLKLVKGETAFLIADVVMAKGEAPDAHFRSTNTNIVRVTDDGRVTAYGQGTANIILYCGNKTAKCTVTVTEELADVMLSKQKDKLAVGEKMVIGADVYPLTSASDRTVSWSVDNKKLASVAGGCAGCVFTAKKAGNVTVTAKIKTKDASGKGVVLVKTCPVRIEAAKLDPLSTADKSYKLKFRKPNVKINGYGNTATVTAVLSNASKAGSVSVDWLSSNEDVIKILESESSAYPEGTKALASATVSACGIGYAYVYARVTDNETGLVNVNRCKVTVNAPAEKIVITGDSLGLLKGDTMEIRKGQRNRLFVDVFPESPTNINKIKWSAKGGVTVKNGVIYANKVMSGVSKVTVTCGSKRQTIFVNVTK